MEYAEAKKQPKKKYSKEEFKKDVAEAAAEGVKKAKKPAKKPSKKKGSKYADFTTKELYQLVSQKRDMILQKKGIPKKLPRGRAALEALCKKMRLK